MELGIQPQWKPLQAMFLRTHNPELLKVLAQREGSRRRTLLGVGQIKASLRDGYGSASSQDFRNVVAADAEAA